MNENYTKANALCTPSKLPASDYVINPYIGCTHRCVYCYACFMGRFTGHTEKWGTYIEPKKYDTYKLPKKINGKTILIGSVTDGYNPAEKRYRLMPPILEALAQCQAHVEILTKSSLVLRDIELLKRIPDITVGISLSNLNDDDNRVIEPGAASAAERIHALRELHKMGIKTYLFVAPYLPGITSLQDLYAALDGAIDYMCIENLNLRGSYKRPMLDIINKLHPEVYDLWNHIYVKKCAGQYWRYVEEQIHSMEQEISIPLISYLYHDKIKKS